MASDNEASCVSDPNFAVICSFLECFGKSCGINYPDIARLQEMLEDTQEVPQQLVELHIKLLRKLRKTVSPEKWERALVKFCHTYSNQDGWELERFGYKKARIGVKLRLLKVLLEAQFDLNTRFKLEVNKLAAEQLRVEPLGRDKTGLAYWFQLDEECNIRVYREDLDEENWELVARDREGVVNLINLLSDGEGELIPVAEDSSNSLVVSEKPTIDTGQVEDRPVPMEETKPENNKTTKETRAEEEQEAAAMTVPNDKIVESRKEGVKSIENNVNVKKSITEQVDDEQEEEEDDEEGEDEEEEEEEEEEDEEVTNDESSKVNSDENDEEEDEDEEEEEEEEDEEEEEEEEEGEEDSQEAPEIKNQTPQPVIAQKVVDIKVPPMTIEAKQVAEKSPRTPWKVSISEVNTEVPISSESVQIPKPIAAKLNALESIQVKAIETPVITTSPLKLINIHELQNPAEDRGLPREEKYPIKSGLPFQAAESTLIHPKFPVKPIDQLAANLSRIQSEKLEKPGAAKLLEKIAENLARSSGAQGATLLNGDDAKVQDLISRGGSEKSSISVLPSRSQRGMNLSTSPRGWESSNDHARPMDYSGIDLSSRKVSKPADVHSVGSYRPQDFQHREMDLSTKKVGQPEATGMPYDSRSVILRNRTMVTDLSKKQMYPGYEVPQAGAYHGGPRIGGKEEHRLPNYTILPDPSKLASMRMSGGPLKRPMDMVEDPQQEMLKRMRTESLTLRSTMDKRITPMMSSSRRDDIVGAAIEEPVMMVHGEGSGSDCDAVNPIIGEAIEEQVVFFYGEGAGRECDTGNPPGDDTSSDNKESNESKKEACSDVTTSLTPSKIINAEGSENEATTNDDISPLRINTNYSQTSNPTGASDNCQSTVVSSVSPKAKFRPTLGVQVIARTSSGSGSATGKKSSRWDVGRPEDKAECDSSIVSSGENISTPNEGINVVGPHRITDSHRLSTSDDFVPRQSESDDITSTSNQTFVTSNVAECSSSSVGDIESITNTSKVLSAQPDSSLSTETSTTVVNECETKETDVSGSAHCDSSVAPSVATSSADHIQSVVSTVQEDFNIDESKPCDTPKSEEKNDPTVDSPPRFFFGPNCVSYSSKSEETRSSKTPTTSDNTPENPKPSNDNNNFVEIDQPQNSESSSTSCDKNIVARLNKVEITDEKLDDGSVDKIQGTPLPSDSTVQSSSSPVTVDKVECLPMDVATSQEEKEETIDTTDRMEICESKNPVESHPQEKSNEELVPAVEKTSEESKVLKSVLEPIQSSMEDPLKHEFPKILDAELSSSTSLQEAATKVDSQQKDDEKAPADLVENIPPTEIHEVDESRAESINPPSDSNDQLPETTFEEAASSTIQVSPDDSIQTNETNDDKAYEAKELELSSDLDEKTKQSMESEDDSCAMRVVKMTEENANNELCNEDAQDGFSKSSEVPEETKENVQSSDDIVQIGHAERIHEERSETSVQLPEDSSGDSVALSYSSVAVNPSEDSTASEICEGSSLLGNPETMEKDKSEETVTPAPISDSNIVKSPERITIETKKASSSSCLLQSMDSYTDDLSENQSSADQDSNEAMVIDDRTSDSNESIKDANIDKVTTGDDKTLNFTDKVSPAVVTPAEKIDTKIVDAITEPTAIAACASSTEVMEDLEKLADKDQSHKKEIPAVSLEPKVVERPVSEKNDAPSIPERSEGVLVNPAESSNTGNTGDEKSSTTVKSSLVPNYVCSDDDDVSDEVFEPETGEPEDISEKANEKESPARMQDEISRLTIPVENIEAPEPKSHDHKVVGESEENILVEESKTTVCENSKEYSRREFEGEDTSEKISSSIEAPTKNTETEEERKLLDEKQNISPDGIETAGAQEKPEVPTTRVETPQDFSEKSDELKAEAVVANVPKEPAFSEKTRETEAATMDCATPSEISKAVDAHGSELLENTEKQLSPENVSKLPDEPSMSISSGQKIHDLSTSESPITNCEVESLTGRTIESDREIDRPIVSEIPKPLTSGDDSTSEESHLKVSKGHQPLAEASSVEKLDIPSSDIPARPETSLQGTEKEIPDQITTSNVLQASETSDLSKESIPLSKTLQNVLSEESNEGHLANKVSATIVSEDIDESLSSKNESKKDSSKRLHGVSDGEDLPPTKSKPPNDDSVNELPAQHPIEGKSVALDVSKLVECPSVPTLTIAALTSSSTTIEDKVAPTTVEPSTEIVEKKANHEAPEIRDNCAEPLMQKETMQATPAVQKSSDIQSVDVKCVDLESDDSMGIDSQSMFETPAEDVDPLACEEDDFSKRTNAEDSSIPKIGIRLKPVADLVYEGWKLDSPEAPTAQTASRKRRNSAYESNSEEGTTKQEDDGETGGKRMKLRGKRSPDLQLRKSVEANRPEAVSSEDEGTKDPTTIEAIDVKDDDDEVVEIEPTRTDKKPRGRPRGRRRRGNRSFPKSAARPKLNTEKQSEENPETLANRPAIDSTEVGQAESKKKRKKRKMVLGLEIGIDIAVPESQGGPGVDEIPVRQSRRIAQLKIKEEADKRRIEEETMSDAKDNKKDHRDGTEKKKRKKQKAESEEEAVIIKEVEREVKSRKRKKKKMLSTFNEAKPWQSSSGSSSDEEGQEEEDEEEIESEGSLLFKSDHEFSPESDLEKDEESEPLRRARTAQKAQSDVEEAEDEYACQKCGKADHPEWILLCDTCDKGWHCSCLRPALMLIPEGDWFCPPCQHNVLVNKLRDSLKTFDQNSKRHENEVLRKKRLAFVGISLDNVLKGEQAGDSSRGSSEQSDNDSSSSSSGSSSSSSSSEESEPVYQLRERRCANTYKFNEYDDMINAAIQDEVDAVQGAGNQGRGKDIATIVNAEKEEAQAEALKSRRHDEDEDEDEKKSEKDSDEDYKIDKEDIDEEEEEHARKLSSKKMLSRKKHRKLNSLDISSEDDPDSDEDFKGSSSEDEEDFDEQLESSDDSFATNRRRGRKGESRPVRRSTRAARTRYDADFVNDDSEDSDRPKRKKSRSIREGSESEDSDNSWRQRKKKSRTIPTPRFRVTSKSKSRKKKKRKRIIESDNLSDNEDEAEVKIEDEMADVQEQPQVEANEETVKSEGQVPTEKNYEKQLQDGETKCETSNIEEENPKKKKKESTPKVKKAPGIRRKIIYGGLDDDGPRQEEETLARRTRGRKINYQDIMGSDSEEELKKVLRRTEESEDEFVMNEGEEFNEDVEKDSDSGDIYSPKKDLPKGKAKSPKNKKMKKSPAGAKTPTDNGTPKQRKKPGPKPGSKNKPRDQQGLAISPIAKPNDTDSVSRGLDIEGSTMSATGSVIGEVPEGSLTGLTPDDINALDDEQIEQMMMEDEEYGRRQLELAAIEIAKNKKQEEKEAKKLEKARLKALEILAAEQQRDSNAPDGTDGEIPKKKKRGRRSKAEILAEQMRRDGVPSLLTSSILQPGVIPDVLPSHHVSPNIVSSPTIPSIVAVPVEIARSPGPQIPLMAGPDGQLFSPDGSPLKPKRRGRGKGKKTLALEAARAAEAAAKASGVDISQLGITGTDSNPEVKTDDIPNVLPTPGSSTSGSAPPTPPTSSVVPGQGLPLTQSPNQQQQPTVYPSLPPSQQSSVITRMLQSQPVSSTPQSFTAAAAAMGHKYFGGPNAAGQMMAGPRPTAYDMPPRGRIPSPYRQSGPPPSMPHFAAVRSGTPPMRMRVPGPQMYHTPHHPMDPSPSGGGPISINSRDRSSPLGPVPAMIPPAAGSPLAKGGPTPPPPPYVRGGPAHSRFTDNPQLGPRHQIPQFPSPSPANHNMQQPSPPPNRPPGNFSPYHPPPPPNYHYGAYPPPPPMTTADDAAAYQGSPYSAEHFSSPAESQPQIQPPPPPPPPQQQPGPPQPHPNEPGGPGNKQYDEEGTGEFGGLVSYFSSQREDDLDS